MERYLRILVNLALNQVLIIEHTMEYLIHLKQNHTPLTHKPQIYCKNQIEF
jgi:hypothetical protein